MEQRRDPGPCEIGLRRLEPDRGRGHLADHAGMDDHRAGPRGQQGRQVLAVVDEADVLRSCRLQRCHTGEQPGCLDAVRVRTRAGGLGQRGKGVRADAREEPGIARGGGHGRLPPRGWRRWRRRSRRRCRRRGCRRRRRAWAWACVMGETPSASIVMDGMTLFICCVTWSVMSNSLMFSATWARCSTRFMPRLSATWRMTPISVRSICPSEYCAVLLDDPVAVAEALLRVGDALLQLALLGADLIRPRARPAARRAAAGGHARRPVPSARPRSASRAARRWPSPPAAPRWRRA